MVADRSKGVGKYSASMVMKDHPKWVEYIKSITGWSKVEFGTLTVNDCKPLPLGALKNESNLGTEPDPKTFFGSDPYYVNLMRLRKTRRWYGGIAISGEQRYQVCVSQQDAPAVIHRLEVYADEKLRDKLNLKTNDPVSVDVYNADDWRRE